MERPPRKKGPIGHPEIAALAAEGVLFSPDRHLDSTPSPQTHVAALYVNLPRTCNLSCAYCFERSDHWNRSDDTPAVMSLGTAKRTIDFLVEAGGQRETVSVNFFGGEPLLAFDTLRATVEHCRSIEKRSSKRFSLSVTTNGVLLDDRNIDFLVEHDVSCTISLDGPPCMHDALRKRHDGAGTHAVVLDHAHQFLAKSRAKGLRNGGDTHAASTRLTAKATLTNQNLDVCATARYLVEQGLVRMSGEPVELAEPAALAIRQAHLPALMESYTALADLYIRHAKAGRPFYFFHLRSV